MLRKSRINGLKSQIRELGFYDMVQYAGYNNPGIQIFTNEQQEQMKKDLAVLQKQLDYLENGINLQCNKKLKETYEQLSSR